MTRRFALPLLCLLVVAWGTPTVHAAPAEPGAGSQATVDAALRQALSAPAPAAADASVLDFTPAAAVTARERATMLSRLEGQPDSERLADAIRDGKLLGQFDGLLKRFGYSPHNLGDVLSAYLVLAWEVVNDADAAQQPAGARAVRRQLAGPLSRVPALAGMDDGRKQAQAERTAYMAMIATGNYQALKRNGDPAKLEALRRDVRADLMKSGVDLTRYRLTPDGLVPR